MRGGSVCEGSGKTDGRSSAPGHDCRVPKDPAPAFDNGVAVLGLGYVGLPTAIGFAEAGVPTIGVDICPERLSAISRGAVDMAPYDRKRLAVALDDGTLQLSAEAEQLTSADAVVICVPTPITATRAPDWAPLQTVCSTVVAKAREGQTLVLTSTTAVGATRYLLVEPLVRRGFSVGRDIWCVFSPERINPGSCEDRQLVPRVVGGHSRMCGERGRALVSMLTDDVHVVSSLEAAELTKLLENTFRAVNIALVNEFADAARGWDIDIREVTLAAGTKPYGFMPFRPGPGAGGHCIPCDPHWFLDGLDEPATDAPVTHAAMRSLAQRPLQVVTRAAELLGDPHRAGSSIAIVGVAYKPGVADVRESPAIEIMRALMDAGAVVSYVDDWVPSLDIDGRRLFSDPRLLATADLVIVHTLHPDFDLARLAGCRSVLDATFELTDVPCAVTL